MTATGTDPRNVDGQAIAITVFSAVKPWGRLWLALVFLWARAFPKSQGKLARLSFIHFARLTIIRRFPAMGQAKEDIGPPLMLFESTYDGTFDQYIDAFVAAIPIKMRAFWSTSYGFPGVKPVVPFKAFIRANEFRSGHFYNAHGNASTTMIASALALRGPHEEFYRTVRDDQDGFADHYKAFLTQVQADL
jgi:hypothetical protein